MKRSLPGIVCVVGLLAACTSPDGVMDAAVDAAVDAPLERRDAWVVPFDGWSIDAYVVVLPSRQPEDVPTRDHPRCEAGAAVDCICGNGARGRQRCTDGGIWEFCAC